MPQHLYSDNETGTAADPARAAGLALAAVRCLGSTDGIIMHDEGDHFRIELPTALTVVNVAHLSPVLAGHAKFFATVKQIEAYAKEGRMMGNAFFYEAEVAKRAAYRAKLADLSSADRKRYERERHAPEFADIVEAEPHPDLNLYISINHFKIATNYNKLLQLWDDAATFGATLQRLFERFGQTPNLPEEGDEMVTLLQIINPSSGKGGNATKANRLTSTNLDGPWVDEYLKFVGYFALATPILVGDDRKTFVIRPRRVPLDMLESIMGTFRRTFTRRSYSGAAFKADILASLEFTQAFVTYARAQIADETTIDPFLAFFGETPKVTDITSGFEVASYKNMGSAFATINLATINVPDWLRPIVTLADADGALSLLDEHVKVISGIQSGSKDRAEGTEEMALLRRYRDFLSGRDVMRFFDFAAHFGDYYLAHRHRNLWCNQFSIEGMELLMAQTPHAPKLMPILQDPGFKEMAAAIRRATVKGRASASKDRSFPYEVRFGLGQELLRAATYPADFTKALSRFIASYNDEATRINERTSKAPPTVHPRFRRKLITEESFAAIVQLIDQYNDAELICTMLVAAGYASEGASSDQGAANPGTEGQRQDATEGESEA